MIAAAPTNSVSEFFQQLHWYKDNGGFGNGGDIRANFSGNIPPAVSKYLAEFSLEECTVALGECKMIAIHSMAAWERLKGETAVNLHGRSASSTMEVK